MTVKKSSNPATAPPALKWRKVAKYLFSRGACAVRLRESADARFSKRDWRKTPAVGGWERRRMPEEASVRHATRSVKDRRGYGIHPAPRLFVVDIDEPAALVRLRADDRTAPLFPEMDADLSQLVVLTPSGGSHWWFCLPGEPPPEWKQVSAKSALLGPGVDTRIGPQFGADGAILAGRGGGQVVGPGSRFAPFGGEAWRGVSGGRRSGDPGVAGGVGEGAAVYGEAGAGASVRFYRRREAAGDADGRRSIRRRPDRGSRGVRPPHGEG